MRAFDNKTPKQWMSEGHSKEILQYLEILRAHPNQSSIMDSDIDRGEKQLIQESEIIDSAAKLLGNQKIAEDWYCNQPIKAFASKTPKQFADEGHGRSVMTYIEMLESGAYA